MKARTDGRRAAMAWYPRPLSGVYMWNHKKRPTPSRTDEEIAIEKALAALNGEGKVEFEAEVHGHPVSVVVEVKHDTITSPLEDSELEWVHGKNNERECIGYLLRGIDTRGHRGHVQRKPTVRAKIIRARRGHHPGRHAFEACDVSTYFESRLCDARRAGMSRHAAWEWAKACSLDEYESLEKFNDNDWCYVGITVTVNAETTCGYTSELASDSCYGVYYDPYNRESDANLREYASGLVAGALREARLNHHVGQLTLLLPGRAA